MKNVYADEKISERLIIAGIKEIEEHGLNDFSLRRVASACEVSCAAPYRHYKNKDDLVLEIIAYINSRWNMMREAVENAFDGDPEKQLIEVCTAVVRFLIANSNYLSVMMSVGNGMTSEHQLEREKLWKGIEDLVLANTEKNGACEKESEKTVFLVKTFVLGTVLALENCGSVECDEKIMFMRAELERIIKA